MNGYCLPEAKGEKKIVCVINRVEDAIRYINFT